MEQKSITLLWTEETTHSFLVDYLNLQKMTMTQCKNFITQGIVNTFINQVESILVKYSSSKNKIESFLAAQSLFANELNRIWESGHKHDDIENYFATFKQMLSFTPNQNIKNYFFTLIIFSGQPRRDYLSKFTLAAQDMSTKINSELVLVGFVAEHTVKKTTIIEEKEETTIMPIYQQAPSTSPVSSPRSSFHHFPSPRVITPTPYTPVITRLPNNQSLQGSQPHSIQKQPQTLRSSGTSRTPGSTPTFFQPTQQEGVININITVNNNFIKK